jgi:hypothetical protein
MVLLLAGPTNLSSAVHGAPAASAERHPSAGRTLKFSDTSSVSTPESEVTLPDSNVICKTLGQAGVAGNSAVDLSVLLDTVKARPMPSPTKAPNPMEDLQIPNDTPGYVLGRASAGNPAPFSVSELFQKSSQSEPQSSGVKELAYGKWVSYCSR